MKLVPGNCKAVEAGIMMNLLGRFPQICCLVMNFSYICSPVDILVVVFSRCCLGHLRDADEHFDQ